MIDYHYFLNYYYQLPVVLKWVWITIIVLSIVVFLLIVFLKLLRLKLRRNERITSEYQDKYEALIVAYLYSDIENEEATEEQKSIIKKIKSSIKDDFKRDIIVAILMRLRNEISGEMADTIQDLYLETGLVNSAKSKLKSNEWYVVSKGIRELTQFHVKEIHTEVEKLVDHKNREVRKQSQLYLINLFGFEGLNFLENLTTPLSEWDQIQLLEILQRFSNQKISDVTKWLASSNDTVVSFALKLVKIYNLYGVKEKLLILFKNHPNKEVKIETIQVLSNLQIVEAKEVIKENFETLSKEEQIAFFKAFEDLFDIEDKAFLLQNIQHKIFDIKFISLKILKRLDTPLLLKLPTASSDLEYTKIVKFLQTH
ncbi:hypothetical protein [Lutibacter sp.]